MQNVLWYICLAIIGIVSAAYNIYSKRKIYKVSTLLVFYLATAGFAWICEFLVLGLFSSYSYRTGLIADPWAQNLLGHLILNTTLYPSAAIVVVTHSLWYVWIAIYATFFTIVEYLFIKLNLYEHQWWKNYMTTISTVIILLVDYKWFTKMNQKRYGLTRAITFYYVAMIVIHTPAPILLLLGKQYYKLSLVNNIFKNLYLSSIVIIFFYHLIESFLAVLFTCKLKKWYWKIAPFIISIVSQSIFAKLGILVIEDNWKLIYSLSIYEIFIAIFILIEKYTLKPRLND